MAKRLLIGSCLFVVFLTILTMLCFVVPAMFSGGSAGGTLASGRSVMTHSDSMFLSSDLRGDTATIKTSGKIIVIEPTTLLVDNAYVATIDEKVSDITVNVKNGTVTFVADGKTVTTAMR